MITKDVEQIEIPFSWKDIKLKTISTRITKGTTPSTIGGQIHHAGEIRFLRGENIGLNGDMIQYPEYFIDEETDKILQRSRIRSGDLLFVIAGTLGKVVIVPDDALPANTNQAVCLISLHNDINRKYIFYYLQSQYINSVIDLNKVQTAQPNLSIENVGNIRIKYPPRETQKQIADFLDKETARIDTLISKKQKQIELLQEKRQAIITQSVTRGLNPDVKMKDSGVEWIGEIPDHWDTLKMRFLFLFTGGGTPSTENSEYWGGEIPWVSSKDMKTDFITDTQDHITELGVQESSTNLIPKGTLLIVMRSGILQHSIPCSITEVEVSVNQDIKAFIPKKKIVPDFYSLFIKGYQKQLLFQWRKQGATVESLDLELIKNFKIVIPPYDEQNKIVQETRSLVDKNESVIDKIQKSIDLLKEYRFSLITHAVSGQIDIGKYESSA